MKTKKSLAREVRQESDFSERRRVEGGFVPFNPYFVCNTSDCVTVRPVRGHLTPKMNIAFFKTAKNCLGDLIPTQHATWDMQYATSDTAVH